VVVNEPHPGPDWDVAVAYVVRTTSDHDPFDDDTIGLTHAEHSLLLRGDRDELIEAATVDTYTIDPTLEPHWFITMDAYSQELCDVAEILLHHYTTICSDSSESAVEREAATGRFVVITSLHTDPAHRGYGQGLTLLDHVITAALRTSTFAIGIATDDDIDQSANNYPERCDTMAELLRQRSGARLVEPRVLVRP